MTMTLILALLVCGLIVGVIARFFISSREDASLLVTVGLGLIGAVLGGLLYAWVKEPPYAPFSFTGNAWHSWLAASLAAIVLIGGFEFLKRREA